MKVAIAHEWLTTYAGSEKVVEQILKVYPKADLYSLVDFLPPELRFFIKDKPVATSFIQQLPFAQRHFRRYLPFMPLAVEQFDLSIYDLLISSNHAVSKGIVTGPEQLHISYVHTPIRYAWELQHQYLRQAGLNIGLKNIPARLILHYMRLWDLAAASRVDCFIANSRFIARRIWKTYRRKAQVIYPPVDIGRFKANRIRDEFYLVVSRCVPYKRVDLIVSAFNQLGRPLVVVGDGPTLAQLKRMAKSHIQLLGEQSNAVVEDLMSRCKAFIFSAEEDFGITLVEAQAAGAPVIAYGQGGAAETVIEGKTGMLFMEQSTNSLVEAIKRYEADPSRFRPEASRKHAEKYSVERFQAEFRHYTDQIWGRFQQGEALE